MTAHMDLQSLLDRQAITDLIYTIAARWIGWTCRWDIPSGIATRSRIMVLTSTKAPARA